MKLGSKYFDSIRISGKRSGAEKPSASRHPPCQWKGCDRPGPHRAPKGRGHDGEYFFFCADHVRQYNQSYNYFDGMTDREVSDFQKDAMTGHRPTWKMGSGPMNQEAAGGTTDPRMAGLGAGTRNDPHGLFARQAKMARAATEPAKRKLRPVERKSLDALNLGEDATREEIKTRFKELVKRHHPDANGGDNRSEDRLRDIIQAYNHLKQAGLV
jgi:curved DNA-binding protein CbpA